MTKGQRAMAVAMNHPKPEKLKRGGSSVSEQQGIPKGRLSEARTVLQYAPDLADNVLAGSAPLDIAYKTARERKTTAASEEAQLAFLLAQDR